MNETRWSLFILAGMLSMAQSRIVDLKASDGTLLKATYFDSGKPGPGVLLLHQCNQQRKLWDVLGKRLAAAGVSTLTLDQRGFGESGGTPDGKLSDQEKARIRRETWPGDIDLAYQYLLSQPDVRRDQTGAGGASCGVDNAIQLARRHPEVKALALLAGPADRDGRLFLRSSNVPIFSSAADDDEFDNQVLLMQWIFSVSRNPASRFQRYATGGHGAEMFPSHPELVAAMADWFAATLTNKPSLLPRNVGQALDPEVARALETIDQQGAAGAAKISKRATNLPEFIVNQLGYEHLLMKDTKGAVEILKLNALAYPNSPNVYDSLSDAYLASGQKHLALRNARKALELLPADRTENEARKKAIQESSEQKIKQLSPP